MISFEVAKNSQLSNLLHLIASSLSVFQWMENFWEGILHMFLFLFCQLNYIVTYINLTVDAGCSEMRPLHTVDERQTNYVGERT